MLPLTAKQERPQTMLENIDFVVKDIQILIPASPLAGSVTLANSLFYFVSSSVAFVKKEM